LCSEINERNCFFAGDRTTSVGRYVDLPYDGHIVGVVAVAFTAIHWLRLGFKHLLGQRWEHWYVRRAVDVALSGSICLGWTAMHFLAPIHDIACAMHVSDGEVISHGAHDVFSPLVALQSLEFFLGHFFAFVILPSFIVGLGGYTLERRRVKRNEVENAG